MSCQRRFAAVLISVLVGAAFFSACDAPPEDAPPEEEDHVSAPSNSGGGGGGGDIDMRAEPGDVGAGRPYEQALDHMKRQEFDEAHELLQEELHHGEEDPHVVQEKLKIVEDGLMNEPRSSVADVFSREKALFEKYVSIRGRFVEGGVIGQQSHYFWVYDGNKLKCRYHKLRVDDRIAISRIKEGTLVLVRGVLRAAGADSGAAYLEVSFFRTLHPARKQAAAK